MSDGQKLHSAYIHNYKRPVHNRQVTTDSVTYSSYTKTIKPNNSSEQVKSRHNSLNHSLEWCQYKRDLHPKKQAEKCRLALLTPAARSQYTTAS